MPLWHTVRENSNIMGATTFSTVKAADARPLFWVFLRALVLRLVTGITVDAGIDPSEHRHRGDLHIQRGPDVYSLAWVVEIKLNCNLSDVIGNVFNKNVLTYSGSSNTHYSDENNVYRDYLSNNVHNEVNRISNRKKVCSGGVPLQLILLKKLTPFNNTYVVAHPYFKTFSNTKRNLNQITRRRRQTVFSSTNKTKGILSEISKQYRGKDIFLTIEKCLYSYFKRHPCISYAKQEVLRPRQKRRIEFQDPLYEQQWHLNNTARGQYDINVISVWESGITGRGVTVCVIDDGLEWRHPDLRDNYNPAGSYDINSDDDDPSPVKNGERNEHGTRCAGEIAAVANNVCGVGVAYRANISGIRVLGGRMTDSMEAAAFIQGLDVNDIYSCSWGPDDDGRTVDGPHHLAGQALIHGITYGRKGYGAIYVVASGNGGRNKDNCNFDGYANSVFTITIGAVDFKGQMPYYAEECAAMLAVTPSSDSNGRDIVTTDWSENSQSGCTKHHSGTSAAAPLAAAVVALALEVQPCLSWRDVQHLIALTSRKIDVANSDWTTNGAGLHHSHQHGFGLIDASAMVSAATVWESVPFSTSYTSGLMLVNLKMPTSRLGEVIAKIDVSEDTLFGYALNTLEFVQARVTIEHEYRGSLKVILICPSGTRSTLAAPRDADNSTKGLNDWALGTVRCWGENPVGTYQLKVIHTRHQKLSGTLVSWQLVLHGSSMTPFELQERRELARRAIRGEVVHVNHSQLCHPPELHFMPFEPFPERWLKAFIITGVFLLFMAVFNSVEYIFCYNDEKEKFYKKLKDLSAGRAMTQRSVGARRAANSENQYGSIETGGAPGDIVETHLPLMMPERCASPSLSCDADVSSLNGDSDDDALSSHCTSDTVVPKDTDVTDFTNDEFLSEADEERRTAEAIEVVVDNT